MNEAFNLFASQVIAVCCTKSSTALGKFLFLLLFVTDSPSISLYRGYYIEVKNFLDPIININFPDVFNMFTSFYRLLAILASQANTNYIRGKKLWLLRIVRTKCIRKTENYTQV